LNTTGVVSDSRRTARGAALLLYCSFQFFVLTIVAMFVYPGGTHLDPHTPHYEFTRNFFSDLGATRTYSGQSNLASEVLFIIALASIGLSLVAASGIWRSIAKKPSAIGAATQIFAIVAGLCYVGIAATPWNLLGPPHMFFVKLGFSLLLGLMLCMVYLQHASAWPFVFIASNWIYIVALAAYVYILFYGPKLSTDGGLEFQVVAQKIIVYLSIANLATQAYGLRRSALAASPTRP
jgi:hypothetical membrane protein